MNKLYILIICCGIIFIAYTIGVNNGNKKCNLRTLNTALEFQQQQNTKRDKINAETYHTPVRDIRRILHEKYTITD